MLYFGLLYQFIVSKNSLNLLANPNLHKNPNTFKITKIGKVINILNQLSTFLTNIINICEQVTNLMEKKFEVTLPL